MEIIEEYNTLQILAEMIENLNTLHIIFDQGNKEISLRTVILGFPAKKENES